MYITLLESLNELNIPAEKKKQFIKDYLSKISSGDIYTSKDDMKTYLQSFTEEGINRDLFEFCLDNNLSLLKSIIIQLKLYFESTFLYQNESDDLYNTINPVLNNITIDEYKIVFDNRKKLDDYQYKFWSIISPYLTSMFKNFNSVKKYNEITFEKYENFNLFLLSIIINEYHIKSLEDIGISMFEEYWKDNHNILCKRDKDENKYWWKLAGDFYGQHNQIGDSYFHLDTLRFRNSLVEAKWLKHFSKYEISLQELLYKKKKLELTITFKNHNNDLSYNNCIMKAKVELQMEEELLKQLKVNSKWSESILSDLLRYGDNSSDRVLQKYRQQVDQLFRVAVKLLHPDRRRYLMKDIDLTKEQEGELNKLYNEIINLKKNNSLNPIDMVTGDYFSLNKIKRIISQAKLLLSEYGVSMQDIKYLIIGNNYEAQIEFLRNERMLLDIELASIQAEIQVLYSDREYFQKQSILKNSKSIESVKKKFEQKINMLLSEVTSLNNEIMNLFKEKKSA